MLTKILAVIMGLSLFINIAQGFINNGKSTKIEALEAQVTSKQVIITQLKASITTQNTKVTELEQKGAELKQALEDAKGDIFIMEAEHAEELATLRTEVIVDTSCDGVMDWMVDKAVGGE